jgi:hypothetical protein
VGPLIALYVLAAAVFLAIVVVLACCPTWLADQPYPPPSEQAATDTERTPP